VTAPWLVPEASALAPGVEPAAFAAACREAGLALLRGAAAGWSKRELATWLLHSYRAVSLRPAPRLVLALDDEVDAGASCLIRASAIEELLGLVRVAVCVTLAEIRAGDTTAVNLAMREGRLACTLSSTRHVLWLPIDQPRTRLEARVTSLFIADYLFDPTPYERDLTLCDACGSVSFCASEPCCYVMPLVRAWAPRGSLARRDLARAQ